MNNSDMPAMPQPIAANENEFLDTNEYSEGNSGLTKREHFAGLAMQAILSNPRLVDNLTPGSVDWIAIKAAIVADAQLAELDKEDQL
jgi:hypothetical protein